MRVIMTALAIASLCACEGEKPSAELKPAESSGQAGAGAGAEAEAAGAEAAAGAEEMGSAPPADFPIPIPAGVKGTFVDDTSEGQRMRMANFKYSGSSDELATQCEKAIRDKGLTPQVQKLDLGQGKIVKIEAVKGGIEVKAAILTDEAGASLVNIAWTEPAR